MGVHEMTAGNNADRDLAERGKQTTKVKEENARVKGSSEGERHPPVPPGLEKPAKTPDRR